MKKIIEEIRRIMRGGKYNEYRFIATNYKIELKLSPKNDAENEMNWIIDNTSEKKNELYWQLKNIK